MSEKKPVFFDIEEQEWVDTPNGCRSVILQATPRATMQNWEMPAKAGRGDHNHAAEQLCWVRRGKAIVTIEGKDHILNEGCFGIVYGDVVHAAFTHGNATASVVDMFLPYEDYRIPSTKVRDLGHKWDEDEE